MGPPKRETRAAASVPELELLGNRLVPRQIGGVEVIQKAAALADHFQKATAGAVVLDVALEMLGQMVNPLGQKGDLHISRPCVALVNLKPRYRLAFFHSLFDQLYYL